MVIEEFYYGNLCPMEESGPGNTKYWDLNRGVVNTLNDLKAVLIGEQMVLVNQLHAWFSDLRCYEAEAKFRYGFVIGLCLMQEATADSHFQKK